MGSRRDGAGKRSAPTNSINVKQKNFICIRNPVFRKQGPYKLASFWLLAAKLSWNFNQFHAFRIQLAQTFTCSIVTGSNLITPKEILYSPAPCFCPFRIEIGKKNGNPVGSLNPRNQIFLPVLHLRVRHTQKCAFSYTMKNAPFLVEQKGAHDFAMQIFY